jgi:hypothetical protein
MPGVLSRMSVLANVLVIFDEMQRVPDRYWFQVLPVVLEYNRGARIYDEIRELVEGRYDYLKK